MTNSFGLQEKMDKAKQKEGHVLQSLVSITSLFLLCKINQLLCGLFSRWVSRGTLCLAHSAWNRVWVYIYSRWIYVLKWIHKLVPLQHQNQPHWVNSCPNSLNTTVRIVIAVVFSVAKTQQNGSFIDPEIVMHIQKQGQVFSNFLPCIDCSQDSTFNEFV